MNLKSLTLAVIVACTLLSCQKDKETDSLTPQASINDLAIPTGFTWENSRDVNFDITISDTRFPGSLYMVSIYNGEPTQGGRLLSKGAASSTVHFLSKVYLANTIKDVYVVKTAPDNSFTTEKVTVSGLRVELSMSTNGNTAGNAKIAGVSDSPDCNTGCKTTVSSSGTVRANNKEVICVTGSNIYINLDINNGGTVRICGSNVRVYNTDISAGGTLIITNTGSVTFNDNDLSLNKSAIVKNYGTMNTSSFSSNGELLNEGILVNEDDFSISSNGTFTNNGVVNVSGSMTISPSHATTNNGSIVTGEDFVVGSNATFINNCSVWAKDNYRNNNTTRNYGLIKVNDKSTLASGSDLQMYDGAMLQTENIELSGLIQGNNSTSLVKVLEDTKIYSNGKAQGALQYCDADGIEYNNGTIASSVTKACDLYIPVTNCNTEGNGSAPITDTDNDGIVDNQDEYPNDPTKAFNNYYPSSSPADVTTVAFEDQWPIKGDYDLNDVVMSYRYKIVTNAGNTVVQVNGDYTLRATGGGYQNGFGIEFPIERSKVNGLSSGTLESNQSKAVIILFTDMRSEMEEWNTRMSETKVPEKTYSVSFNVSNGPTLNEFGLGSYNPFIWNGNAGNGRSYEIHLSGKTPTDLANKSLYGSGDDNSNTGANRYYLSQDGLPWAINIPASFDYATEETEITNAYLKFASWVESGGSNFADWYSNRTGYRNADKIYSK